jgi:RNA polymerase sigma-70 factor, ECF subfamily
MADPGDFDAFYLGSARRLLRYAFGLTGDAADAQDLVQEAYARAWQRWRRLSRYDDAEGWLRLVVTRLATDRWRRLSVRRAAASTHNPPRSVEPPSDDMVVLVAALRTLPLPQRRALALHYLLDFSVNEIARETGASPGTVKSWLSRGRVGLAAALGETLTDATTGGPDAC